MQGNLTSPEYDLLWLCADDYTDVSFGVDAALETDPPPDLVAWKARAIELVCSLIRAGLIVPGEWLIEDFSWQGTPDALCERFRASIEPWQEKPMPDTYPVWLIATERGKAYLAELDREGTAAKPEDTDAGC